MTTYNGTPGDDQWVDTTGDDVFNYGDVVYDGTGTTIVSARGLDTIASDGGGNDSLSFGNLKLDHLAGLRSGNDLVLLIQAGSNWTTPLDTLGGVRITNFFAADGSGVIETITLNDGSVKTSFNASTGVITLQVFNASNTLIENNIFGTPGNDTLTGTEGPDNIDAGAGNDVVFGLGGADVILGGDGNDQLFGANDSSGVDVSGDLGDLIRGGAGDDLLRGNAGDDLLYGEAGDDNLRGDSGNDLIDGGDGYDFAAYRFDEGLFPGGINFSLAGITSTATPVPLSDGRNGVDTLVGIESFGVLGSTTSDRILGSQLDDQLTGNLGNDLVVGNAGDDAFLYYVNGNGTGVITLTDGFDTIVNNDATGFDTLAFVRASGGSPGVPLNFAALVRSGNDLRIDIRASGAPGAALVGGVTVKDFFTTNPAAQIDRIEFDNGHVDVSMSPAAGTLTLTTVPDSGGTSSQVYSGLGGTITGTAGDDVLAGTSGNDALLGLAGNDTLRGAAGSDTLDGGEGYDLLEGGAGDDILDGGPGIDPGGQPWFDIADYRNATTSVTVNLTTGVASSVSDGTDALISIDGVYGSPQGDNLTGSLGHDALWGYGGNDVLYGGGGGDYLSGGDGNDSLYGQDGDDELDGGSGSDLLDGGAGTDVLQFWSTNGSPGGAVVDLAAGTSFHLGSTDTLVSIENVQGTAYDDIIRGSTGANVLHGFDGNDILRGNAGDDRLYGGDADDNLRGDAGNDLLDGGDGYDFASYTELTPANPGTGIGATFDLSWITSTAAAILVPDGRGGNDTVVNIEKFGLAGTVYADQLIGSQIDDQIVGNLGNDLLRGNAGSDAYFYFVATDSEGKLILTDGHDTLVNADGSGAGYDTLTFAPADSSSLGVPFSHVDWTRTGTDLVIGLRETADTASPVVGSVTIASFFTNDPGAQPDLIEFADRYVTIQLDPAAGALQLRSFDNAGQPLQSETVWLGLTLTGTPNVDLLVGGPGDETIYGLASGDTLQGGDGNDTLDGGAGDDTLDGGSGDDVYRYSVDNAPDGRITATDGFDTIDNHDATGFDRLVFLPVTAGEAGVSIDNVYTYRDGTDLVLSIQEGTDWDDPPADPAVGAVRINKFYTDDATRQIDRIEFEDAYALVDLLPTHIVQVQVFDNNGLLLNTALAGVGGNDTLTGVGTGRFILDGGAGDDTLVGGGGDADMAYYTGLVSEYTFTRNADLSITVVDTVPDRDGTDIVSGVEYGRFADGIYAATDLGLLNNRAPTGPLTGVLPSGTEDTAYVVSVSDLLAGFSDPDGDPYTAASLYIDNFISLADSGNGTWTWTPPADYANFNGDVTLHYEVVDINGKGVDATRTIFITPVNDAPVAVDDGNRVVLRNQTITFNVLANDTDIDIARGEAQTLSLVSGSVVLDPGQQQKLTLFSVDYATGLVTATAPGNWSGALNFTYQVTDGTATDQGAFSISVSNEIFGTDGPDTINSASITPTTAAADVVYALAGNDTVDAKAGDDVVYGGNGDDTITGGSGADRLYGESGNDVFLATGSDLDGDVIDGGVGTDTLKLTGNATITTGFTATSVEVLDLNLRTLTVNTTAVVDLSGFQVMRLAGLIEGNSATNSIIGTAGNDRIAGRGGADLLSGGLGNDVFFAGGGELTADSVDGGAGTDTLQLDSAVTLTGGFTATSVEWLDLAGYKLTVDTMELVDLSGFQILANGSKGIAGSTQPNRIIGTQGDDRIGGSAGNDVLNGSGGNDWIYGGTGTDVLTGGAGADTFVFDRAPSATTNWDDITDFDASVDKIYLDKAIFDAVSKKGTPALDVSEFSMNPGGNPVDADDFILYDTNGGYLYYDADGSGTRFDKVLFARLFGGYAGILDSTDFVVGTPPAGP